MSKEVPAVLFVDLLGVRSRWLKGGREEAENAFQDFRNLIAHALKGRSPDELIHGLIETDAAAITCRNLEVALEIGRKMFSAAFAQTKRNENRRPWLRGCIVPRDGTGPLRTPSAFKGPLSQVELMLYTPSLLNAISVEKSGYKGMRLLVSKELVGADIVGATKIPVEGFSFITLKRLRNSTYPKRIEDEFIDYLWMATNDEECMLDIERTMALRLRASARDPEEFAQAAATQVVFHECTAMIGSLRTRQHFQQIKVARKAAKENSNENLRGYNPPHKG